MLSTHVTINNERGIETRQALQIASRARMAKSDVWLFSGSERANAKSIISILMFRCRKDSIITLKAEHSMDIEILNNIKSLIEDKSL